MRSLVAVPRSITSRALKTALAGLIVVAAIAVAPAAASASSPHGDATAATTASAPVSNPQPAPVDKAGLGFSMLSKAPAGRGVPFAGSRTGASTFTCDYFAYVPVYIIDFRCDVTSGAIALWVDCNGLRYYSQALPAVGTYYVRANCSPYLITNFGAISLV